MELKKVILGAVIQTEKNKHGTMQRLIQAKYQEGFKREHLDLPKRMKQNRFSKCTGDSGSEKKGIGSRIVNSGRNDWN